MMRGAGSHTELFTMNGRLRHMDGPWRGVDGERDPYVDGVTTRSRKVWPLAGHLLRRITRDANRRLRNTHSPSPLFVARKQPLISF